MDAPVSKESVLNTLLDMGYNFDTISYAYDSSPDKTPQGVIDYIMNNPPPQEYQNQQNTNFGYNDAPLTEEQLYGNFPDIDPQSHEFVDPKIQNRDDNYVDPQLMEQLEAMGYEPEIAQQAIFMTKNQSIDAAMNWIYDNEAIVAQLRKDMEEEQVRIAMLAQQEQFERQVEEQKRKEAELMKQFERERQEGIKREKEQELEAIRRSKQQAEKEALRFSSMLIDDKQTFAKEREEFQNKYGDSYKQVRENVLKSRQGQRERKNYISSPPKKQQEQKEEVIVKKNPPIKIDGSKFNPQVQQKTLGDFEREKAARDNRLLQEKKQKEEEENLKENISRAEREKQNKESERRKVLEQIARDKAARTGKPMEEFMEPEEVQEETVKQKFLNIYGKMQKIYPPGSSEEVKVKTCLSTIGIYLSKKNLFYVTPLANIKSDPNNLKFRNISTSGGAFSKRIGSVLGGKNILVEVGFEEKDGVLRLNKIDIDSIQKWIEVLEETVKGL